MFKLRYAFLLALLPFLFALTASAQDSKTKPKDLDLNATTGAITIQRTITATANVNLAIGDQIYQVRVPVAIRIDAATTLTTAQIAAPAANQVGVFVVNPVNVEVLKGDYKGDYRSVSPSGPDNVIVVYTAELTNLHSETIDPRYSEALKTIAVDDAGQTYEEKEKVCDQIDPGETATCEFIFDVPAAANLVDLQVQTMAIKRFGFPKAAAKP